EGAPAMAELSGDLSRPLAAGWGAWKGPHGPRATGEEASLDRQPLSQAQAALARARLLPARARRVRRHSGATSRPARPRAGRRAREEAGAGGRGAAPDRERLPSRPRGQEGGPRAPSHRALEALTAMRLGVFGGTFDPPHVGHLALAEWARERLDLDQVLFVP